jgi:hypothetical protein
MKVEIRENNCFKRIEYLFDLSFRIGQTMYLLKMFINRHTPKYFFFGRPGVFSWK